MNHTRTSNGEMVQLFQGRDWVARDKAREDALDQLVDLLDEYIEGAYLSEDGALPASPMADGTVEEERFLHREGGEGEDGGSGVLGFPVFVLDHQEGAGHHLPFGVPNLAELNDILGSAKSPYFEITSEDGDIGEACWRPYLLSVSVGRLHVSDDAGPGEWWQLEAEVAFVEYPVASGDDE
jgi:hypothetical protein